MPLVGFVLTRIVVIPQQGTDGGRGIVVDPADPFPDRPIRGDWKGSPFVPYNGRHGEGPAPGQEAAVMATLLVAPMVGMALMVPGYILATLGSFIRSLAAGPKIPDEGQE
jgi:hypothetical protein